jgi:hypothetical protein
MRGAVVDRSPAVPRDGPTLWVESFRSWNRKDRKARKEELSPAKTSSRIPCSGRLPAASGGGLAILSYKPAPLDLLAAQPV